ncbi:hypothetical protein [Pedomonas mirosovicensis]|uniref:hypothetical protein n=1 Tax=Pedomonas mirosovicensis TaxID=2908641 RepID=UPI0021687DFA|nr:hypothetical protein [Pedomonas mirosovicensis]MCH8683881.1 hypothetical protein [Pedomonas mirosovicensis]
MGEITKPASAGTAALCLPPALRKPRLRRWEASEYLRLVHGIEVAPATLSKWASVGGGPRYSRINRTPLYPVEELDRWVASKISAPVSSTSEE